MTKAASVPKKGMPGAFWSRQKILARNQEGPIFWLPGPGPLFEEIDYELDEGRLKAASYNLKMGQEAYITPVSESDPKSVRMLKPDEAFVIPPGQFAFLLTHEAIAVPDNALALVALRAIELKFQGLVNVSGFHVDPGYRGRLIFAVYNAGPGQIHLREGQILFEVFFSDLDQETDQNYLASTNKSPIFRIEPRFIGPIAGEFETLKGLRNKIEDIESDLEDRIHALEREQSVVRWASALLLGAVIAFGVRECAPPAKAAHVVGFESMTHDR